ncbi:hypothetical protein AB1Y20_006286 [Prymnesium parvum]|uniref:DNA excision repair protein ERCC-1 n=1 Tax=Prymnesium parvum TaxID=97485 RepID=A0AB34J1U0_PRYPA
MWRLPTASDLRAAAQKRQRTDLFAASQSSTSGAPSPTPPVGTHPAQPRPCAHTAANASRNPPSAQTSHTARHLAAAPPPAAPAILVSPRQQGNPVLRSIRNVPWQFGDHTNGADYVLSESCSALFLSLRYHLLHPGYLLRRLREMTAQPSLRVVLLLVDSEDAEKAVLEVTRIACAHECTAVLAWSSQEAARYLETLRAYAKKPADLIKERSDGAFLSQLADCLTTVRPLNKTDVATLHANFGSLRAMMQATPEELAMCPGLGERKVSKLLDAFVEPFVPSRVRRAVHEAQRSAEGQPAAEGVRAAAEGVHASRSA